MSRVDARDCPISGASPAAAVAWERALAAFVGWRDGVDAPLDAALREAPCFVMAHVLRAAMRVCSRDPRRVRSARPLLAHAATLRTNARERLHLSALGAVLDDDYGLAKARLGELLWREPRDLLALHVAQTLDHAIGDAPRMRERVDAVLPAWSSALPGHAAVLAMHAFALVENGEPAHAEDLARAALAANPLDARAHHVMAHVFEAGARAGAGIDWMNRHRAGWAAASSVAIHCGWHLALFHLAQGASAPALALYDHLVRAERSGDIADLIDAAALLWRIALHGGDAGARWVELADHWAERIDDGFCSFNDLHAMLAFVGARDGARAQRLERGLGVAATRPTRHGLTTRQLGLPACRALIAFGRGDDARAAALLAEVAGPAHRFGGSHAQRDVLQQTWQRAVQRARTPRRAAQLPPRVATLAPAGRA